MRIGHYMPGLSDPGGIASYIRRVAAAQRAGGHDVVLLDGGTRPFSWRQSADRVECAADAAAVYDAATTLQLDIVHLHAVLPGGGRPPLPVIRTLLSNQPYCPSGSRYLARPKRACDRAYSVIGCTWGHVVDRCGSVRPIGFLDDFRRTLDERLQARWVRVLAVSAFLKAQMVRSGYDERGIDVLHLPAPAVHGCTSDLEAERPPRMLFTGRLVPQKGVSWLIRAFARACRVLPVLHLDIAGDGPERAPAAALCEKLGIAERVTFHGWLEEGRVFELMRVSRALVFPSVWHEPAGLVTLEAAAHGRPVVASRVGGIPEYASRLGNALIVEPNDVPGMAAAIELLATDFALSRGLGKKGAEGAAGPLSLSQHMNDLMKHYEATILNVM